MSRVYFFQCSCHTKQPCRGVSAYVFSLVMCCCSILSVGGDGMFAEVVHGLLTHVLKASGVDQPSADTILPQPKWRIGIIPAGMCVCACVERSAILRSVCSMEVS